MTPAQPGRRWGEAARSLFRRFGRKAEVAGDIESVFTDVYTRNRWKSSESRSGTGSALGQTETVRAGVTDVIRDLGIRSILDAPCGDFNWMQYVDLSGLDYTGADIVEAVVARNQAQHQRANIRFAKLDITTDSLPAADLVLCRDCLVHLSYADAFAALRNVVASGSTYLMTTTFADRAANTDIKTGGWRVLNLARPPFSLPPPLRLLNENCTEKKGIYKDKSLGLWKLDDIRDRLAGDGAMTDATL